MIKEKIKEILGNKIDQCTDENLAKGDDSICDLIDELEGIDFEYIQKQDEHDRIMDDEVVKKDVAENYQNILPKLAFEMRCIEQWKSDFNEESINLFKRWFFMWFNRIEYLPKAIYLNFLWSNELTKTLMDLSLIYLNDIYGIHRVGESTIYFESIYSFLIDIAKAPFDHELIDIDAVNDKENEELAEEFMHEIENRCADSTCIIETIQEVEFKIEKRDEDTLMGIE